MIARLAGECHAEAVPDGRNLDDAELRMLLARAAGGDLGAFMTFYDATRRVAWRLGLHRYADRRLAQDATCRRYVHAWVRAAEQATSGLSPAAWLLSLDDSAEGAR